MKIWVIGRGYPTNANRHWGSFELEQAKLLAREGHEVCYLALTLSFFSRKDPRGFRHFAEDQVEIYTESRFHFPGKLGVHLERYEDRCWAGLLERAEKDFGLPDVIHVHYPSMISSIHVMEDYRSRGVRLFVTEHWSRVLINNLHSFELERLRYYASHASCFACVGGPLLDAVKSLVPVPVPTEVIPNIVSPLFFSRQETEPTEDFVFVTVGRLVPLKQFDKVIEQFCAVFATEERVRLKLIGPGSERSALEALAAPDSRISFLGSVSPERVAEEIRQADALVSFSKYETFGVPVAEAWACGKPAIVSDQTGVLSYCDESRSVVVPADDPEALGRAMRVMADHPEVYDRDRIADFAQAQFSSEQIYQKLLSMYRSHP